MNKALKAATLSELKTELETLHPQKVLALCMKLAKYKKENKELLTYLLFEANDEPAFIEKVRLLIDEQFESMNRSNVYLIKKSLRKILRTTNKFIKYSGSKKTEVELLIYFCQKTRSEKIPIKNSTVLNNIYQRQILKIKSAMKTLHEDLQFDYSREISAL
jgi:hypothetical protein